ncbi:MAG: hypothetical protein K9G46_02555 [Flavobacteriales bacterium]|nr:hypothetical protein [Flavobacteriales bacterium]
MASESGIYEKAIDLCVKNKTYVMGLIVNVFFSVYAWKALGGKIIIPDDITLSVIANYIVSGELLISVGTYFGFYLFFYVFLPWFFIHIGNRLLAIVLDFTMGIYLKYVPPFEIEYDDTKPHSAKFFLYQLIVTFRQDLPQPVYIDYMKPYYRLTVVLLQLYATYNGLISGEYIFVSTVNFVVAGIILSSLAYLTFNGVVIQLWSIGSHNWKNFFQFHIINKNESDSDKRSLSN